MKYIFPIAIFATMLSACGSGKDETKSDVPKFDTVVKTYVDTVIVSDSTGKNSEMKIVTSYDTVIVQRKEETKK